jgi:acyl-CoA thioester hydrolase
MRRRKTYFTAQPGDPQPIEQKVKRRIAFSEVDAMAVAWHGNYPRFFEAAHTELMQKIGLGFAVYAAHDIAAPIVQCHVDYHSSLILDEEYEVSAVLYWNDGARLDISYTVTGNDGRLCASGYTVQMFCNLKTREPYMFPPEPVAVMRERWRKGEFHA